VRSDGQAPHPDALVLDHDRSEVELLGDLTEVCEQDRCLLGGAVAGGAEQDDRGRRVPARGEEGAEVGVRRDSTASIERAFPSTCMSSALARSR
jgi:hypothetical protein